VIGHGKSPQACLEKFVLPPIAIPYGLVAHLSVPVSSSNPGVVFFSTAAFIHSSTFGPYLSFVFIIFTPHRFHHDAPNTKLLPIRLVLPSNGSLDSRTRHIIKHATRPSTHRQLQDTQRPLLPSPLRAKSIPMSEARFPSTVKRLDLLRHPCRHTFSTGSPSVAEHLSS
jgi:hypothetical protein